MKIWHVSIGAFTALHPLGDRTRQQLYLPTCEPTDFTPGPSVKLRIFPRAGGCELYSQLSAKMMSVSLVIHRRISAMQEVSIIKYRYLSSYHIAAKSAIFAYRGKPNLRTTKGKLILPQFGDVMISPRGILTSKSRPRPRLNHNRNVSSLTRRRYVCAYHQGVFAITRCM